MFFICRHLSSNCLVSRLYPCAARLMEILSHVSSFSLLVIPKLVCKHITIVSCLSCTPVRRGVGRALSTCYHTSTDRVLSGAQYYEYDRQCLLRLGTTNARCLTSGDVGLHNTKQKKRNNTTSFPLNR